MEAEVQRRNPKFWQWVPMSSSLLLWAGMVRSECGGADPEGICLGLCFGSAYRRQSGAGVSCCVSGWCCGKGI
ncbi:hypothetical protein RchiOBHm_Chr7g0214931 [Rosa chinensis]|uniref:Uncharacterized protein n=1 Tax=Rosa chinensis TaxID=74649 RepID=A0A2P6PBC5_ROSCH|nr:hypothetical protein RchiOBHm_Chr7g0214931 [Rosa chinensis]